MSVGRNDPCPCQSGKKYKHCCGQNAQRTIAPSPVAGANVSSLLRQAVAYFEAQRWSQADLCCQQILAVSPTHAEALYVRGAIALQTGQGQIAADLTGRAIKAAKTPSDFMYLHQGMALQMLGRLEEAEASLRQALKLQAKNVAAQFHLGAVLQAQGKTDAAIASYRQVIALQANHVDAWSQLGLIYQQRSQVEDAEACYREALRLQGDSFQILSNLGAVLQTQDRLEEAADTLRRALALQPDSTMALNNLGAALLAQGRPKAAAECYRQALALAPEVPLFHRNLASALMRQGLVEESLACQRQALALEPEDPVAFSNMLLSLQYLHGCPAQELLQAHRDFAARFETPLKAQWPVHANDRTPDRCLKIGYVSPDFRDHAVAYFIEPVLAHHDKSRVEVFCYYNNVTQDAVTERLRAFADHWRPCRGLSDAELAEQVQTDGIDILVDLTGHTALNRLLTFARKPAPVQVTWMGYPGTTGLQAMDYRLTDAVLDPEGTAEACYTETVLRLPAWAAFRPVPDSPPVSDLPALSAGHITLACLNNLAKITPAVIRLWARILKALPAARLMIGNASEADVRAGLEERFAAEGVAADRLQLLPKMPLQEYLALHHRIDLALDPFPFTGGVTTNHSLWMGVPVITLTGETTVSRQGGAIMKGVGLPEFVTRTEAEYLSRVVELAGDLPHLQAVRQSLRGRMTDSISAGQVTQSLEQAYAGMWRKWCAS